MRRFAPEVRSLGSSLSVALLVGRVALISGAAHASSCRGSTEPSLESRPGSSPAPSSIERRFDTLSSRELATTGSDHERAAAIGAAFDELLASAHEPEALSQAGERDLDLLFRAAHTAASYTLDRRRIGVMTAARAELERRGAALPRHHLSEYEILVKARMFGEARAVALRHPLPDLEPLPELREAERLDPAQPTEWVVDPDGRSLTRRNVELRRRTLVIAVSHPRCGFSRAASAEIEVDPVLGILFAQHGRWLAPPSGRLDFDKLQQWNREHPAQPITLVHRKEEWPMLDSWATPTFYILEDGAVRSKVTGWPEDGRRTELIVALQQVKLVP